MVQFSEWFESSDYSVEKWWAGAERTDNSNGLCEDNQSLNCCWEWPDSGKQFTFRWGWGPTFPKCGHNDASRLILEHFQGDRPFNGYLGVSVRPEELHYLVCQKRSTTADTTTSTITTSITTTSNITATTESNIINNTNTTNATGTGNEGENGDRDAAATSSTSSVPAIAGGSAAGFLVIVTIIIIVGCWCWRRGKCPRRNDENVEANEIYGGQEDYYEYDKADYNTNVTDTNDMYGGDKDNEDAYDSE